MFGSTICQQIETQFRAKHRQVSTRETCHIRVALGINWLSLGTNSDSIHTFIIGLGPLQEVGVFTHRQFSVDQRILLDSSKCTFLSVYISGGQHLLSLFLAIVGISPSKRQIVSSVQLERPVSTTRVG